MQRLPMFQRMLTDLRKFQYRHDHWKLAVAYRAALNAIPKLVLGPTQLPVKFRTHLLSRSQKVLTLIRVSKLYTQLYAVLRCIDDPAHCRFTRRMMRAGRSRIHVVCYECKEFMMKETNPYVVSALERIHCKLLMWI